MTINCLTLCFRCVVFGIIWDVLTIPDKISFAENIFEAFTTDEISYVLSLLSSDEALCGVVEFLKVFLD